VTQSLEDQLRDDLRSGLGPGPVVEDDWTTVQEQLGPARRRQQRRRLIAGVAAVVIAVVIAVALVDAPGERVSTGPTHPSETTAAAPSTSAGGVTTSTAASLDQRVRAVSSTPVFAPGEMIATSDGAWVVSGNVPDGPAPVVLHVSPAGRVVSRTALPGVSQTPVYLASGEGAIWAATWVDGRVFRLDPSSGRITQQVALSTFQKTGEIEDVAAGFGHVYVTLCCVQPAGPDQVLLQLDPGLTTLQGEVGLRGAGESERVTVGPGVLLVTGEGLDKVQVIDPVNLLGHEVAVLGGAGPVTVGDAVDVIDRWFPPTGSGFGLSVLDPVALTSHHVLIWPEAVGQVAAGHGVLWARGGEQHGRIFVVVDGRVREVADTETSQGGVIAASGDVLWVVEGAQLVQYRLG
jgi:hypothetical protein